MTTIKTDGREADIHEADIHRAVIDHWRALGLPDTLVATIPNMRAAGQYGLTKGLPDLLVIGPDGVGFIEMKAAKGKPSKAQETFRRLCIRRGIPMCITYGRDEPIDVLEGWGVVRRSA